MSASRAVTSLLAALSAAFVLLPAAWAGGGGSISTTTTTVASGTSFTVTACVATAGDGGYLVIKGPNTFSQDLFFGPVTGCTGVVVATPGWAAGKYRITGYEQTAKGAKSLGAITVDVT